MDLFWAILDLWVLLYPQGVILEGCPPLLFCLSHQNLQNEPYKVDVTQIFFNHHLSPPPSINRKSIHDVDVSYYLNLFYFIVN